MRRNRKLLQLLALGAVVNGCSSTETGNPEVNTSLSLALTSSNSAVASVRGQTGINVEHAWLSLGKLEFTACDAAEPNEILTEGLVLDVAFGNRIQRSGAPEGRFCGLNATFALPTAPQAGAPKLLEMGTLVVQGKRQDGVTFELQSSEPLSLSMSAPKELDLTKVPLILTFDVARWFQSVDLNQAVLQAGQIGISHGQNTDLLRAFEANVPAASDLRSDENRNGRLDPSEPVVASHR